MVSISVEPRGVSRALSGPIARTALAAELVVGAFVVSIAGLTSYSAWRVYETAALPLRAPVAVSRAGPAVRLDDRKAVKRAQRVKELLGEANAYRAAKRQEWADETLGKALALDPANAEARAIRASWDANPLPPLTPEEIAAREREAHLAELLGAAGTIIEANEALPPAVVEEVRGYIEEALALAPDDPTAHALAAELPASYAAGAGAGRPVSLPVLACAG